MKYIYRTLLILAMLAGTYKTQAQCDPILRPDSSQIIFDAFVNATAQVGNTMYVAGGFTSVSKYTGGFARVDPGGTGKLLINGSKWPKVSTSMSLPTGIYAVVDDGNGGWIVGGSFSSVSGTTRNRIAQINAAGQLTTWNPNMNGDVNALYRNGTTLYVGGSFTTASGQTRNRIAAYDLTTGNLTSWNPNSNSSVLAIAGSGGNIYVGGSFTNIGAQLRSRLAAISASTGLSTSWDPNLGIGYVLTMTIDNNTVYVGGSFSSIGSQSRQNAAGVDLNTGVVSSWAPNPNGSVNRIVPNSTNVFIGGDFSSVGGQPRTAFGEVNNSTGIATTTNLSLPASSIVNDIQVYGNSFILGGYFTLASGHANTAKYNLSTKVLDANWSSNMDGIVYVSRIFGTELCVAGSFSKQAKIRKYAAAYDLAADTLLDWHPNLNNVAYGIAANSQKVYIGGDFTSVGGLSFDRLVEVNPLTAAPNMSWTPSANATVNVLRMYGDTLYVGGFFTSLSSTTRLTVASYNVNTNALTSWSPPGDNAVFDILVDGTTVYLGGSFNNMGGNPRKGIAVIPYNSNTSTSWNANITGSVLKLKKIGNTLYAGGSFQYQVTPPYVTNLAAINATTAVISTTWMPQPNNYVRELMVDGDLLYVGGAFTFISSQSKTGLSVYNHTTGVMQPWNPAMNGDVWNLTKYNDRLWVFGQYSDIAGQSYTPKSAQFILKQTAPVVTITGNDSICIGTPVTYTATTAATGASFQWKVNGVNVGTNSPIYTAALSPNDQVKVDMTLPIGTCYTSTTATSNVIKVSLYSSAIVPTVTVSGSNTVCTGSAATYTATTNITGGSYQWKVNGLNAGTNSSMYNYTPANGDVVSVVVTIPSTGCYASSTATSTGYTVTVNNPVAPTISISTPSTTVCTGNSVTYTATTNVTGGSFEWYVNNVLVPTATNSTYTYTPANGDNIKCTVTIPVGGCFLSASATSNALSMVVNPGTGLPTVFVAPDMIQVCQGITVNYSATTNVSGATYEWRVNGNIAGTNSATYSYAPSAGDQVTCTVIVPANTCFTLPSVTSTPVIVQVNNATIPSITVASNPAAAICEGTNVTFTSTSNVTGGTYIWKVNGTTVGNNATYSYVPQNGDIIFCTVIAPAGCYTAAYAASPITVLKVDAKVPVSINLGVTPIVELGKQVYVNTTVPAGIINYSIEWKRNGVTFATTTTNATSYTKAQGIDTITAVITTADGCYSPGTSPEIYVYSVGVGVNDVIKTSGIEVFPNPFRDRITVKGLAPADKLLLYDMTGKSITPSAPANGTANTFMFNDIVPGAYLLKVINAEGNVKANIPLRKM